MILLKLLLKVQKQIEMNKQQEKQNCRYKVTKLAVIRGEGGGSIGEMVKGIKRYRLQQ